MSAVVGDDEVGVLAAELARLIGPMRDTSKFAVRTFLEAVREGHLGAQLTIHSPERRARHAEASFAISPRRIVDLDN